MRKSKTSIKVSKMDLCQTPAYGLEPLLEGLGGSYSLTGVNVWECAMGEAYLANALHTNYGANVYGSDIVFNQAEDFLKCAVPDRTEAIITNPPFTLKREFTDRALQHRIQYGFKVALLMQTEVVSTKWFFDLLTKYDECGIIWFNPRINFKMPNKGWEGSGSHFSTAWFTWGWFVGNKFVRMEHWSKDYRKEFEF